MDARRAGDDDDRLLRGIRDGLRVVRGDHGGDRVDPLSAAGEEQVRRDLLAGARHLHRGDRERDPPQHRNDRLFGDHRGVHGGGLHRRDPPGDPPGAPLRLLGPRPCLPTEHPPDRGVRGWRCAQADPVRGVGARDARVDPGRHLFGDLHPDRGLGGLGGLCGVRCPFHLPGDEPEEAVRGGHRIGADNGEDHDHHRLLGGVRLAAHGGRGARHASTPG